MGFRGEINVILTNCSDSDIILYDDTIIEPTDELVHYPIQKGIAQFLIHQVPVVEMEELSVEELINIPSQRGQGMLGSSGK